MRLLLAVGHVEMQRFIARDYRIDISEVADNAQELYEILEYTKADTLILSRYLKHAADHNHVIEKIKATRPELKVVYLYGEADDDVKTFVQYLESWDIFDYHIGSNISSLELNKLLFNNIEQSKVKIRDLFKRPEKSLWLKELTSAVITIYSNSSNGKSNLAWNLATGLSNRWYKTTLINLDKGYSANIYFGIDNIYFDLLDYTIAQEAYKCILERCYKKGNLNIITGRLGDEAHIANEDFLKLLYFTRSKSDIVIIDTYTGLFETTLQAINNSNIDFLIFDCDLMHFHMNKLMLEKLSSDFIDNKTIAIINNCNTGSESYKYIYKQICKMNFKFKGILPLSSCGSLSCDLMCTGKAPYEAAKSNSSFFIDMNNIMDAINARHNDMLKHILNKEENR